ncbi:hypothetical protein SteCoe_5741 [Stentor coeruleus]|uniref:Uncharacterized protein n=1 Tax=Stentor coeruleus TaxID=5963 RepID=A0A1R2CRV2_9CILI|nr:hypothetical protein SteCoe_5741 [Stentor coeruleus]
MIKGSYWDIDDILAEEEPVMIETTKEIKGAGFLYPQGTDLDLKKSSRFSIPLWLGISMARRDLAKIEVPKFFSDSYRNTLKADPKIISLKERTNYFFEVGIKLSDSLDGAELVKLLYKVFLARFIHLFNEITHNSDPKIIKKLTELELELYEKGMRAVRELYDWKERKFDIIRTGQSVAKNTKRFKLK